MSEKEIEKLAQLIVEKLIAKQEEMDSNFIENIQKIGIEIELMDQNEETMLKDELIRLKKYLKDLEYHEEYEKAMIIARKIKAIKKRLSEI